MKDYKVLLYITDQGDPSVGMFPCTWTIECPFGKDDYDKEMLEWFRDEQMKIYKEYVEGRVTARFNFEDDSDY